MVVQRNRKIIPRVHLHQAAALPQVAALLQVPAHPLAAVLAHLLVAQVVAQARPALHPVLAHRVHLASLCRSTSMPVEIFTLISVSLVMALMLIPADYKPAEASSI